MPLSVVHAHEHAMKVDAADEAFARAGELNPRLDLTVVAQASGSANRVDFDVLLHM